MKYLFLTLMILTVFLFLSSLALFVFKVLKLAKEGGQVSWLTEVIVASISLSYLLWFFN